MRHTPKKLTDCPENLREAIDWLIQVRYGNGGNDGLGELAKALKKLIEYAIKSATESFNNREKELTCPDNPSAESSYCQSKEKEIKQAEEESKKNSDDSKVLKLKSEKEKHYNTDHHMTKEDRERELNRINESRIKLGQLAGQLGSFIGGGGKVNEAVQNAIKAYEKQLKKCQNSENNLHNSVDCQDPPNCQSIKEQKEKLESLQKANEGSQNNPEELLKNLCSGLETFLGFNSASKGYDGTGIVYSDLDRLCDGVMGFLSGIITEVKNNENLNKYNTNIDSILEKIKQAKYNRKNFDSSIVAVSQGIRDWVSGVEERHRKVVEPLRELEELVNGHTTVDMNGIYITEQLSTWQGFCGRYLEKIEKCENASENIDSNLRNTLWSQIELVGRVFRNFETSLNEDALINAVEKLSIEFTQQRKDVKSFISSQMKNLQDTLNNKFLIIESHTKNMTKIKNANISALRMAVNAAKKATEDLLSSDSNGFERGYKKKIDDKFSEIKTLSQEFVNSDDPVTPLQTSFKTVRSTVENLSVNVQHDLNALKDSIERLDIDALAEGALSQLHSAKDALTAAYNKGAKQYSDELNSKYILKLRPQVAHLIALIVRLNTKEIKRGLSQLAINVGGPLGHLKDIHTTVHRELQAQLNDVHRKLSVQIEEFKKKVNENLTAYIRGDLGVHITSALTPLTEVIANASADPASLGQIVKQVGSYAAGFPGRFQSAIRKMAQAIMEDSGGAVSSYLESYAGGKIRDLKQQIESHVLRPFQSSEPKPTADGDAHTILKSMKLYLDGVTKTLSSTDAVNMSTTLERESHISPSESYKRNHLKLALKPIISATKAATLEAASLLNEFITDSRIQNLAQAILRVQGLAENLKKAVFDKGDIRPDTLGGRIKTALEGKINIAADGDINIFAEEAAKAGTDRFRDSLRNYIIGAGGDGGLNGEIQKEIEKLKSPTDGTDPFQIAFRVFDEDVKALVKHSVITASTQTEFNDLVTQLTAAVTGLENEIHAFDENAQKTIMQSAGAAIDAAVEQFGNGEIRANILMHQFTTAREILMQAIETIHNELEKLKNLPETVKQAGEYASGVMEELKSEIGKIDGTIKKVSPLVDAAEKTLTNAIESIERSLGDTRSTVSLAFQHLRIEIQGRMNNAFDDLEDSVQKMFAQQKISDLKALHACVSDHLLRINSVIVHDSKTGFKGLMHTLRSIISLLHNSGHLLNTYANRVHSFFRTFLDYLAEQSDLSPHSRRLTPLAGALSSLLSAMHSQRHFDATVSPRLADLQAALDTLSPAKFADASPLLNVVKAGVQAFHGELAKQYVSRYSGKQITWVKPSIPKTTIEELTTDATKCAKVFMTILGLMFNDFKHLSEACKETKFDQIHATDNKYNNTLGHIFSSYGFSVSMFRDSHEGELRNKPDCTGTPIYNNINNRVLSIFQMPLLQEWLANKNRKNRIAASHVGTMSLLDILQFLYECLEHYYTVSHLRHIERPKSPSSVYQMLCWLTGLPHNRVFPKVSVGDIGQLFEKADEETKDAGDVGISLVEDDESLPAYPAPVKAANIRDALQNVCVSAEDVLIGILGHGHADGIYAVDFNTNPDGFSYPTAPGACFDMLSDILSRLYQQLYFLYGQCSNEEPSVSWRDCWYGNQVGGSDWKCNAMQCPNQKGNQIHKQRCNQKCDQIAQCGIKSPLQSFLEDGLPGFLPHSFSKPGCKLTCTLSNHRGIPCRTPMGFAEISVTASHRQKGEYLKKVLEYFCGTDTSPLTQLCAQFTCLLQKPPQTLGDIFAFYYGYLEDSAGDFYGRPKSQPHRRDAFTEAVNEAYFGKTYTSLNPSILRSSGSHSSHSTGDLISISNCKSGSVAPCGLYVKSVTQEISKYYSSEHKANHLSWIVYITETFYDLLKKLYDDCCNKCGPAGSKCYTKSCDEKCSVKYTTDKTEQVSAVSTEHQPTCKSIVTCRDTHPTLYKYGFTFGNTIVLNGSRGNRGAKRTCNDFCEALNKMLGEKSVLIELRKQIDQFLWDIREKFSFTVLALWLLSLLYLLHILIIRLDLLHIKSHLHSPSSHRIAAQSLLAAGRVNKLNRVFYLQP